MKSRFKLSDIMTSSLRMKRQYLQPVKTIIRPATDDTGSKIFNDWITDLFSAVCSWLLFQRQTFIEWKLCSSSFLKNSSLRAKFWLHTYTLCYSGKKRTQFWAPVPCCEFRIVGTPQLPSCSQQVRHPWPPLHCSCGLQAPGMCQRGSIPVKVTF